MYGSLPHGLPIKNIINLSCGQSHDTAFEQASTLRITRKIEEMV